MKRMSDSAFLEMAALAFCIVGAIGIIVFASSLADRFVTKIIRGHDAPQIERTQ